jgi:hypothetical protein
LLLAILKWKTTEHYSVVWVYAEKVELSVF